MTKIGYIDTTDFYHELGECSGGTVIYATLDDILEHNFCSKGCGVLKVEIRKLDEAVPSDLDSISFTFEEMELPSERFAQRKKERIEHLIQKKKRLEKEIDSISKLLIRLSSE